MDSIRALTLRPSSSFLVRSLGLSGSRCPIAHWPSPRGRFCAAELGAGFLGRGWPGWVLVTDIVRVLLTGGRDSMSGSSLTGGGRARRDLSYGQAWFTP